MKIVSKFSDSYDYLQYIGEYTKDDIIYIRSKNNKQIGNNMVSLDNEIDIIHKILYGHFNNTQEYKFYPSYKNRNDFVYINLGLCIIGEKFFPYIHLKKIIVNGMGMPPSSINIYLYEWNKDYFIESINSLIAGNLSDHSMWKFSDTKQHLRTNYENLYLKIRKIIDNPIILTSTSKGISIDGSLKNKNIKSIIKNEDIFQEIEMYLNKLRNEEKNVIMSDIIKRDYAGFTPCSFKNCDK